MLDCLAGDAVDGFTARFACLLVDGFPLDPKGLADMRKIEIVIECRGGRNLSDFDTTMFAIARTDEFSRIAMLMKIAVDILVQLSLVQFDGKMIVRPSRDQVSCQFTLGQQGIGGNGSPQNIDAIEQRCCCFDFISLFFYITPGYRQCTDFF